LGVVSCGLVLKSVGRSSPQGTLFKLAENARTGANVTLSCEGAARAPFSMANLQPILRFQIVRIRFRARITMLVPSERLVPCKSSLG
jgi:hypothetical protein